MCVGWGYERERETDRQTDRQAGRQRETEERDTKKMTECEGRTERVHWENRGKKRVK